MLRSRGAVGAAPPPGPSPRPARPAPPRNVDRPALAYLPARTTPERWAALGRDADQAARMAAALRDPALAQGALAGVVGELADRGLTFLNGNGDGRFTAGEQAFAD